MFVLFEAIAIAFITSANGSFNWYKWEPRSWGLFKFATPIIFICSLLQSYILTKGIFEAKENNRNNTKNDD
jgi:hypothetical protein